MFPENKRVYCNGAILAYYPVVGNEPKYVTVLDYFSQTDRYEIQFESGMSKYVDSMTLEPAGVFVPGTRVFNQGHGIGTVKSIQISENRIWYYIDFVHVHDFKLPRELVAVVGIEKESEPHSLQLALDLLNKERVYLLDERSKLSTRILELNKVTDDLREIIDRAS